MSGGCGGPAQRAKTPRRTPLTDLMCTHSATEAKAPEPSFLPMEYLPLSTRKPGESGRLPLEDRTERCCAVVRAPTRGAGPALATAALLFAALELTVGCIARPFSPRVVLPRRRAPAPLAALAAACTWLASLALRLRITARSPAAPAPRPVTPAPAPDRARERRRAPFPGAGASLSSEAAADAASATPPLLERALSGSMSELEQAGSASPGARYSAHLCLGTVHSAVRFTLNALRRHRTPLWVLAPHSGANCCASPKVKHR